jgi:hypothetical protein
MRFPLAFIAALQFATVNGSGQTAVLWNKEPLQPGTTWREETRINLEKGSFSLEVNNQALRGAANATVREIIARTSVSATEQRIAVLDSARNIRLGFGSGGNGGKVDPKDTTGHLQGKELAGRKVGNRWVFTLAGKREPDDAETSALKQFNAYAEAVEALGLLYGTEPRKVGETWKPNIGPVKTANPEIDADLECTLEAIKPGDGDTVAQIAVKGRLTASIANGGRVQIAINGVIHRSLRDMVDLDAEVNGNFRYTGQFGKGGSRAEIEAPVKLTRTVKPGKP